MKHPPIVSSLASLVVCTLLMGAGCLSTSHAAPVRATISIGSGAVGQHAFEFIGKIDQNGGDFTSYGYLIHIRSAADSLLFTSATTHSEATARFTFYAPGKLVSRSMLGTLFTLTSRGTFSIYALAAGGASFDNPASFKQGARVASLSVQQQSVVTVLAPNQGILKVWGEATQKTARAFSVLGRTYRVGRVGQREQVAAVGQGVRLEPSAPRAVFNAAGNFVVVSRGKG